MLAKNRFALTTGHALLGALLTACSFTARQAEAPSQQSVEQNEKAQEARINDGFVVPEAESVNANETPCEEGVGPDAKAERAHLGYAWLQLGKEPPWRNPASLEQPPNLRAAPALATPATDKKSSTTPASKQWRLQKSIWVGEGYLYQAEFTPDLQSVVTLSTQSGSIYHYELKSGKLLNKVPLPEYKEFDDAAFVILQELPERPQMVLSRPSGSEVLDLESGKFDKLELVGPGNGIEHAGPFGLYGTSYRKTDPQSGTLRFIWIDGQVALELECERRPDDWALSQDGKFLAVQYYPGDVVQLLDLENQKLLLEVPTPRWGGSVALSPDGSLLAVGGEKLVIHRVSDGALLSQDKSYQNNIDDIRFTPDGQLLLVSAYDGKVRSYALPEDLSSFQKLPTPQLLKHSGSANVYQLGLSPDARLLVTPSGDKSIKIWTR